MDDTARSERTGERSIFQAPGVIPRLRDVPQRE